MIKTSAPGKLILFGEHAVVYGEAAIATAVNKRTFVTAEQLTEPRIIVESKNLNTTIESGLTEATNDPIIKAVQDSLAKLKKKIGVKLVIDSQIPFSVGMGASASIVTAVSGAVLNLLQKETLREDIAEISHEAEKLTYGKPSGLNTSITTFGGTIYFQKGRIDPIRTEPIEFVVGNTGSRKSSKDLVDDVKKRVEDPRVAFNLYTIGSIVRRARTAILENNLTELGSLMNKNHKYLRDLGVSSVNLERLINTALGAGAYGAKLTGAGGGGCMMAITDNPEKVISALENEGASAFLVRTHQGGVRIEQSDESGYL